MAGESAGGIRPGIFPARASIWLTPSISSSMSSRPKGQVHEAGVVRRHRQRRGDEEDAVVLVGSVGAREGSCRRGE